MSSLAHLSQAPQAARVGIAVGDTRTVVGGVEAFSRTLAHALRAEGIDAQVVDAGSAREGTWNLLITNGSGVRDVKPDIHIYHGCWVEHLRRSRREGSRRWATKRLLEGAIAEFSAGKRARVTVAVSETAGMEVAKWYRTRNTRVIENMVDEEIFR